jgi:hypothetical protein
MWRKERVELGWIRADRGRLGGMNGHVSSPLRAAVGLVATAADGARHLPRFVVDVRAAAQRRYDELALHGRDVLAGKVTSVQDPQGWVETGPGPVAVPVEENVPVVVPVEENVPVEETSPVADDAADLPTPEPATAPPRAVPPIGRSEPVELPEDLLEEVAQLTPGDELAHADLPLPDFDHQTVPQLRGRLRSLSLAELVQLRDYEQAHAARLPVLTLLDNRIAKLLESTAE